MTMYGRAGWKGCELAASERAAWRVQVLADMGDEQSLSASLSTFSGHLRRIQARTPLMTATLQSLHLSPHHDVCIGVRRVLGVCAWGRAAAAGWGGAQALRGEADGKGLVLLDEVGTGTEPVEGAALGIALLRTLARGGLGGAAVTFSTTHHRRRSNSASLTPDSRLAAKAVHPEQDPVMLQRMLCEGDGEEQCKISTAALAAFNQMQHCMGEERDSPSGTACYAQQGCNQL